MKIIFAIILVCSAITVMAQDERIIVDAKINGQPARFFFDTGAGVSFALFSTSVSKFGLKYTPPAPDAKAGPGQILSGWSELCNVNVANTNISTRLRVIELPAYLKDEFDGVLGWPAIKENIFSVDFVNHAFNFLTNVPEKSLAWTSLRIATNYDALCLELPNEDGKKIILVLDSGSAYGAELNPQKWHQWKLAHTNQPITLNSYFTPNSGLVVAEQSWADKISLGSLTLNDVPIEQCNSGSVALFSSKEAKYEATLGFAALKRLDIIVDGKHGVAYLRPKTTPPVPYIHNRLGAAFVPLDMQSNDLIAHVVDGGPAYEAGIREGDILLEEDGRDVMNWHAAHIKINAPFREQPAGTKIELTLKRGDKVFKTTATLRNILPPDAAKTSN